MDRHRLPFQSEATRPYSDPTAMQKVTNGHETPCSAPARPSPLETSVMVVPLHRSSRWWLVGCWCRRSGPRRPPALVISLVSMRCSGNHRAAAGCAQSRRQSPRVICHSHETPASPGA
jgi:hypothetical protein